MENTYLTLGEQLGVSALTLLIIGTMFYFFKWAILKSVDKSIQEDLLEKEIELNGKLLSAIENQKADIQKKLNEQNAVLEQNVLSAIENQKADIQKKLNEQMADFQVAHTRYSYIKREEINAYKIFYGKLLKAYFRLKNYVTYRYGIVDLAGVSDEILIEHINNLKLNERLKNQVVQAITKRTNGYEKLFKKAELYHNRLQFREVNVEQEEYFLENELFFDEKICEHVRTFQSKMDNVDEYFCFAEEHGYLATTVFYGSYFEKSLDEKTIKEYVKDLYKDLDVIKELIKKEIHEH